MKQAIIWAIAFLTTAIPFSAQADNDKIISFENLPETSKKFIRTHFKEADVSYIKLEKEMLTKSYEVYFVDGSKVEFDKKGKWEEVDCVNQKVPEGIIPGKIQEYKGKKHPDFMIVKISRDRKGYEIELNNGVEIKFNTAFEVVEYDN